MCLTKTKKNKSEIERPQNFLLGRKMNTKLGEEKQRPNY